MTGSIKETYKEFLLENGKKPVTVYAFAKANNISETEFFDQFNSFEAIDRELWKDMIDQTLSRINAEEVYQQYSVREKLLSFYYTLIEIFKSNRSYILLTWGSNMDWKKAYLKDFLQTFEIYLHELVEEGVSTKEIINRPIITEHYAKGIKAQVFFVIDFWIKDTSKQFEKTDVAIEKAVNATFDLIGKNPLDSVSDFAKFLFQQK